ncbi:MAG: hypothetical protein HY663_03655 [Chloroflexi bacterium]|nr:hypothetical protein [Chloroflexota bacterium]
MEVKELIREANPIEEMAGLYTPLSRDGASRLKGLCPIHSEHDASFFVYPETQSFYCFGCGSGGDVFDLVMLTQRVGFWQALCYLDQRANTSLLAQDPHSRGEIEEHRAVEDVLTLATQYYHSQLLDSPEGLAYLRKRGITEDTCRELKLGYASGCGLAEFLRDRGVDDDLILKAGLVGKDAAGSV